MNHLPDAVFFPKNVGDAEGHRGRFILAHEARLTSLYGHGIREVAAGAGG